jgi:hypothetical protein
MPYSKLPREPRRESDSTVALGFVIVYTIVVVAAIIALVVIL